MARRPLAGRDKSIIQGHRRDEFFARMRRKGGVPRLPSQGATAVADAEEPDAAIAAEDPNVAEDVIAATNAAPDAEAGQAAAGEPAAGVTIHDPQQAGVTIQRP